jgi:Carboxypeptidase regulatory-like domain
MARAASRRVRWTFLALAAAAPVLRLAAQAPTAAPAGAGQSVSGIVYDSVGGKPLADAAVQLVKADSLAAAARTAMTDSLGHFRINDVPAGHYLIGFLHPMTDSLGIEPKLRDVIVDGRQAVRVDLAIPSPHTLRVALCGATVVADSEALIFGIVRTASDRAAADSAHVIARWVELSLGTGGLQRTTPRHEVLTHETGWYAICGAPVGGTIALNATRGADSTEALDLEVPIDGFLRRDLWFGVARLATGSASRAAGDSTALAGSRILTGDGRLSGVVVAALGGRPLGGARVGIANGPQTRADERGQWILTAVPTGTRTLEVKAVAHYPVVMPVDVIDGAPPIRVAMLTLKSVLDTVMITATRKGSRNAMEFMNRRRSSGGGRFLTSADIASRSPAYTADLFRTIPGVYVDHDRNGDDILTMNGGGFAGRCRPSVFLNGMSLRGLSANDINSAVRPSELIGVEVYARGSSAPAQYTEQNGCGSVLFWTR